MKNRGSQPATPYPHTDEEAAPSASSQKLFFLMTTEAVDRAIIREMPITSASRPAKPSTMALPRAIRPK